MYMYVLVKSDIRLVYEMDNREQIISLEIVTHMPSNWTKGTW